MKLNKISTAVTGALLLTGIGSVQADPITFTDSFSNVLTELNGEQLRVSLFDASHGTLTGVRVMLTTDITSEGTVINNGAGSENFTASTLVQSYAGTSVGSPLDNVAAMDPFTEINSQEYSLDSGASDTFGPGSTNNTLTLFDGMDEAFIGEGAFGFDFSTQILTTFAGGGGNIAADVATSTSGTLTVVYLHEDDEVVPEPTPVVPVPVPEPTSLLLLGLGLAGMAGIRRKKQQA